MGKRSKENPISTMLVDDSFASQDDGFVDLLRQVRAVKYLAALADRWGKDPRPWARQQIFRYLALPMDRPGHHPIVKRLFKHAEAKRDHELMAMFLVAFDRLVRRQRRMKYRWEMQTRELLQEEYLATPHNQITTTAREREAVSKTGKHKGKAGKHRIPKGGRLFTYRTRDYLRRRAWRYFRRLGFQHPNEYPEAIAVALREYRDEDFHKGENIIDNWSLMHAAFRRSPILAFGRTRIEVAEGHSLGELVAAPQFEGLWKQSASTTLLLHLLLQAHSRLVRVWALQLLQREHIIALQQIDPEELLSLLDHAEEEVQQFGARLLETMSGTESWPVHLWLRLLDTTNLTVLGIICDAIVKKVLPDRLSFEQLVMLASARATPVARLGLKWLKEHPMTREEERGTIVRLADAECEAIGTEAATFALGMLSGSYRAENVIPFFDSLNPEVRRGAWDWLTPESLGYSDPVLWTRLLESPYDDVRLRLVDQLVKRSRGPDVPPVLKDQDLTVVWTTVLLNIHRGGRAKLKALRQISQAIAEQPARAESLIPALTVAIRSVRPAEVRAGLSSLLTAVAARPALEELLSKAIPELHLTPEGAV